MRVPLGALRQRGVLVVPQLEHSWPAERSSSDTLVLGQTSSGSDLMAGCGDGMADMVQQRRSARGSIGLRRDGIRDSDEMGGVGRSGENGEKRGCVGASER